MSKTLDQERILDSLKRQPRFMPSIPQTLPETVLQDTPPTAAVTPEPVIPEPILALPSKPPAPQREPSAAAATPPAIQPSPIRRRYALRVGVPLLLCELAFIRTVHPPMALPDLGGVPAQFSAWLQRPAAAAPQIPQPTPYTIPAAVQPPLLALPSEPPVPKAPAIKRVPPPELRGHPPELRSGRSGARPGGKPSSMLPSASAAPIPRTLTADVFAPRSPALEDTRKVLRLMESALQDAAYAVVAAQDGTAHRR